MAVMFICGVSQVYFLLFAAYYKTVAVKTKLDRENHAHDGVSVMTVTSL